MDLRRSSPSFGRHVAAELSAENARQLYVPVGFAHGFCTLEPDTEIAYKVDGYYAPDCDAGLAWDDPILQSLDLEYHNVDPEAGLYLGLEQENRVRRVVTEAAIAQAVTTSSSGPRVRTWASVHLRAVREQQRVP